MRKKDIKGYEGLYYVTDFGELWSYDKEYTIPINNIKKIRPGRKIKPCVSGKNKKGYFFVNLLKNGVRKKHLIHRLVAGAFLKNKKNKNQVNHINGNKLDNRAVNLEWCNSSENGKHARNIGKIKTKINMSTARDIRSQLKSGATQQKIANIYGISQAMVSAIKLNKKWVD